MRTGRQKYLAPYSANHNRVRKTRGSASAHLCEGGCGASAADWSLRHDRDGFDPGDYVPLCRSCHYRYDQEGSDAARMAREANPDWCPARFGRVHRDELGRFAGT